MLFIFRLYGEDIFVFFIVVRCVGGIVKGVIRIGFNEMEMLSNREEGSEVMRK